jgi:hypothetical protein
MKGIAIGTIIVILSILGIAMAGIYISIADSIQSDNSDQGEDGTSIDLESNNPVRSDSYESSNEGYDDSNRPTDEDDPETQEILEFPTLALPILSIISLMLLLSRKRCDQ